MKSRHHWISCVLLPLLWRLERSRAQPNVVLKRNILELTNISASLSVLAYSYDEERTPQQEMEVMSIHNDGGDQAMVVKKSGYCFGIFRQTSPRWNKWLLDDDEDLKEICASNEEEKSCCRTRSRYYDSYNNAYRHHIEEKLHECAAACPNKDECVVLTGHSQGGAIATVASVALAALDPYVITFGQPPTILSPCERIRTDRWYRWINTQENQHMTNGISYDPVPFVPGLGDDFFGHRIILSNDDTGVAYIGLNSQDHFASFDVEHFEAHSMFATEESPYPGYADRIRKIVSLHGGRELYPIRSNGFLGGSSCTDHADCESQQCARETGLSWMRCLGVECNSNEDCKSNRCDSGLCVPKLGSCQVCEEDSDCESGSCSWRFRCAETKDGLMGDHCQCNVNADCVSNRCEGFNPPICEAKLAVGAACNEGSDCISEKCSWGFQCSDSDNDADDTRQQEYPTLAARGEQSNHTSEKSGIVTIAMIVGVVVLGYFLLNYWFNRRRREYEEIPTNLTL